MLGKTKRAISVTMALCMLMTLFAVSLPVRAAGLANRFYQSQLNSAEKEVYSKLDSIAQDYFQNKTNATEVSYNNKTYYRTNTITCAASFSQEDLQKIVAYYLWENPIYYYFMDECYYSANADGTKEIAFFLYPMFKDGSTRFQASTSVVSKLNSYNSQISGTSGDYEKAKAIHDLILANVALNTDLEGKYMNKTAYDDSNITSHSLYSTLVLGTGNSIGYTKLFYTLCNYAGINAVCVTSDNHAWNLVTVGGKTYHVDTAWDDATDGSKYSFFLISGAAIKSVDVSNCHTVASMWARFTYPATNNNYSADKTAENEKVTIKKLKNTSKGVKITWNEVSDPENLVTYRVQRKAAGGEWKTVKKTADTSFTDKNVKNGKTYKYRIAAVKTYSTKTVYGSAKKIKVSGKK